MSQAALRIIGSLLLCATSFAQSASYYNGIQKATPNPIPAAQFRQIETDALKNYTRPESYELLATSFGNTTEKVWAVIYGEVYCNLSSDADRVSQVGSLIYGWYDKSLTKKGNNLSINLTEASESANGKVPFESQFEQSFLFATIPSQSDIAPSSIKGLTNIRKNQLSLWNQKKLPQTQLVRRQTMILTAGHFEAYNYWLFKSARPDEFNEWIKNHGTQFQAWLDWWAQNKFSVESPDFHRLSFNKAH